MPPHGCSDWNPSLHKFLSECADEDLMCRFGAKKIDEYGREIYSLEKLETKEGGVDIRRHLIEKGFAVPIGEDAMCTNTVAAPTSTSNEVGLSRDP